MSDTDLRYKEDVKTKTEKKLKTPSMYKVFLINDDYTTMDFVVIVLERIFHKPVVEATQIMLHVHNRGKGLCGIYNHEIAETKIAEVHALSRKNDFPLKCTMEEE